MEIKKSKLDKKISALKKAGKTNDEIAEVLGIKRSTVVYHNSNKEIKPKNWKKHKEAQLLLETGMSLSDVSKKLGIANSTLYLWFSRDKTVKANENNKVICPVCGNSFKKRNKTQRYCSPECSRKANKTTSSHIRRIRKQNQTIDRDITLEGLYRRDSGFCYICGMKCSFEDYTVRGGRKILGDWYPTIDHIIPLCNGGSHSWGNVKLAHKRCNEVKGTKERL